MTATQKQTLFPDLQLYFDKATLNFSEIPVERKFALEEISTYIRTKNKAQQKVQLTFICTHNSRRSHISQLMAQAAAAYYNIDNVHCYSGGTEVTAFHINAVNALKQLGFVINPKDDSENPLYEVYYGPQAPALIVFSKLYTTSPNPHEKFGAVLTCSSADKACPIVYGAEERFKLTYEDPKKSDGTPEQQNIYRQRAEQIGMEMLYIFSLLK